MTFAIWAVALGLLLITMAMTGALLKRLPVSPSMLYLAAGAALGPAGVALLHLDPINDSAVLEHVTEAAVLISLFVTGLKLSAPLSDIRWRLAISLALGAMVLTVGAIALIGVAALGLPVGAAILLGAILAPTDPVLASEVQVADPQDRDRLRFALTGEGGLNDGLAFPFAMLGLGLLGLHELGPWGARWLAIDCLWAIAGGLLIGAASGRLVGNLVLYLRVRHREAVGFDEFLALGLIALSYGIAVLAHTYGFLAVFAAGLALRHAEDTPIARTSSPGPTEEPALPVDEASRNAVATDPLQAGPYLKRAILGFNEQMERIVEVAVVLIVGAMLAFTSVPDAAYWFVPVLLLMIRPVCVWVCIAGSTTTRRQRVLIAWFGIRGIGSVYYLMYAINHGLDAGLAEPFIAITLTVVATSIVIHGVSVTPLMQRYARRRPPTGRALF